MSISTELAAPGLAAVPAAAQAAALHLPRPDHLAVRELPGPGPGEDHRGGRGGLLPQALRRTRRSEDAGLDRGELLEALPRFPQARRCAAQIPHPHRQGLPLRLRALSRPRAAQLPGADRGQRALQPDLPDLLCQLLARPGPGSAASPRSRRMLDLLVESEGQPDLLQISGGEPTLHPQILDIIRAARAPADPPRHAQHQRPPHRQRSRFCRRARRDEARLRGLSAIRRALGGGAADHPRRRSAPGARARARCARRGPASRRRWSASSARASTTARSATCCATRRSWPCVRGVTFQPVQDAGRNDGFDPAREPHRAVGNPPRDHRPVGRLRRGRHDPLAVQSRRDLDRLWDARRGEVQAADAPLPAGGPGPGGAELGHLREQSRDAQAAGRAALAVLRRAAIGQRAARGAVLPAAGRGARRRSATTGSSG